MWIKYDLQSGWLVSTYSIETVLNIISINKHPFFMRLKQISCRKQYKCDFLTNSLKRILKYLQKGIV